jgi:hypothetical protein
MRYHLAIGFYLSTNSLNCHVRFSSFFLLFELAAASEDFRAHIAAGLGPFVVLLCQDRADEAQDGVAGGEDADHIGAADFLVQVLLRVVGPDLAPDLAGGRGEGQDVVAGVGALCEVAAA